MNRNHTDNNPPMKIIAHFRSDFGTKFGIPRQSGLVGELTGRIEFEPEYNNPSAFNGLEGFSHLWIIWQFSHAIRENPSLTVKPPRLGGNTRMGVFATRSPFRPNPIGLSCVKIIKLTFNGSVPVIYVAGADLMDGTPIYDIKPYLPYTDSHPDATGGFSDSTLDHRLEVVFPAGLLKLIPQDRQKALIEVLRQDPRPGYIDDKNRKFGFEFAGYDIRFTVSENILTVFDVVQNV